MTKAQQLKAERLLLESYIKTNPQVKTLLDGLIKKENVKLSDIVQPIIQENLKEARMIGVNIGWQAAFLRCEEAITNMNTVEEIKAYVHEEANKIRTSLSIKDSESDASV